MNKNSRNKKIHLATDHAGYKLKETVKEHLDQENYHVVDHGATAFNKKDDYPDFIHPAAKAVARNPEKNRGIIFGHSGQGEAMVANRHQNVRAAVFYGSPQEDSKAGQGIIELSRRHNDANVLSIGTGFVSEDTAINVIDLWLSTEFSEATRHKRRIQKIDEDGR